MKLHTVVFMKAVRIDKLILNLKYQVVSGRSLVVWVKVVGGKKEVELSYVFHRHHIMLHLALVLAEWMPWP